VLPGGAIGVRPRDALNDALRDAIRQHRDELALLLANEPARPPTWRVVVESCGPHPGPITLSAWATIIDPAKAIEADLVSLATAIEHRNAGRETAFTRLIDEYLVRLAVCGAVVRVEAVQ
jgi:hypothetical protein